MSKGKSINAMIKIEKLRKNYLIDRKSYLMEHLAPDGIKTSYMGNDASHIHGSGSRAFEDILPEIMEIQSYINECNKELEILQRLKEQIFEQIEQIDSISDKVRYLRDYIGLKLQEISDVTGYSYDYVKELSAKINKANASQKPENQKESINEKGK
ncbi:hypothetical protein [Acetobacterium paludosum]|uniref:hypothetical protein n=1 Tax=Acetobacterium paludosum TaxID=52693 RepID=UPI00164BC945|nr:hypothetical protein [Acetobacterium paludosum]